MARELLSVSYFTEREYSYARASRVPLKNACTRPAEVVLFSGGRAERPEILALERDLVPERMLQKYGVGILIISLHQSSTYGS